MLSVNRNWTKGLRRLRIVADHKYFIWRRRCMNKTNALSNAAEKLPVNVTNQESLTIKKPSTPKRIEEKQGGNLVKSKTIGAFQEVYILPVLKLLGHRNSCNNESLRCFHSVNKNKIHFPNQLGKNHIFLPYSSSCDDDCPYPEYHLTPQQREHLHRVRRIQSKDYNAHPPYAITRRKNACLRKPCIPIPKLKKLEKEAIKALKLDAPCNVRLKPKNVKQLPKPKECRAKPPKSSSDDKSKAESKESKHKMVSETLEIMPILILPQQAMPQVRSKIASAASSSKVSIVVQKLINGKVVISRCYSNSKSQDPEEQTLKHNDNEVGTGPSLADLSSSADTPVQDKKWKSRNKEKTSDAVQLIDSLTKKLADGVARQLSQNPQSPQQNSKKEQLKYPRFPLTQPPKRNYCQSSRPEHPTPNTKYTDDEAGTGPSLLDDLEEKQPKIDPTLIKETKNWIGPPVTATKDEENKTVSTPRFQTAAGVPDMAKEADEEFEDEEEQEAQMSAQESSPGKATAPENVPLLSNLSQAVGAKAQTSQQVGSQNQTTQQVETQNQTTQQVETQNQTTQQEETQNQTTQQVEAQNQTTQQVETQNQTMQQEETQNQTTQHVETQEQSHLAEEIKAAEMEAMGESAEEMEESVEAAEMEASADAIEESVEAAEMEASAGAMEESEEDTEMEASSGATEESLDEQTEEEMEETYQLSQVEASNEVEENEEVRASEAMQEEEALSSDEQLGMEAEEYQTEPKGESELLEPLQNPNTKALDEAQEALNESGKRGVKSPSEVNAQNIIDSTDKHGINQKAAASKQKNSPRIMQGISSLIKKISSPSTGSELESGTSTPSTEDPNDPTKRHMSSLANAYKLELENLPKQCNQTRVNAKNSFDSKSPIQLKNNARQYSTLIKKRLKEILDGQSIRFKPRSIEYSTEEIDNFLSLTNIQKVSNKLKISSPNAAIKKYTPTKLHSGDAAYANITNPSKYLFQQHEITHHLATEFRHVNLKQTKNPLLEPFSIPTTSKFANNTHLLCMKIKPSCKSCSQRLLTTLPPGYHTTHCTYHTTPALEGDKKKKDKPKKVKKCKVKCAPPCKLIKSEYTPSKLCDAEIDCKNPTCPTKVCPKKCE